MPEATPQGDKVRVFVAYSRDDLEFAEQLDAALRLAAVETQQAIGRSISAGEDWKKVLSDALRDADTIIFLLSPSSARSAICAWEVEEAVRLGKRIIPVVCCALEGASPPQQLVAHNYIYFYAEPNHPGSGFGTGLAQLASALHTNLDWLREYALYLRRATEWNELGRTADRLLFGSDVASAKAWAARRPKMRPHRPTCSSNLSRRARMRNAAHRKD